MGLCLYINKVIKNAVDLDHCTFLGRGRSDCTFLPSRQSTLVNAVDIHFTAFFITPLLLFSSVTHPEVMMDNIEVCKVWETLIQGKGSFDTEFDLPATSFETVSNFEADSADNHPDQMFQLKLEINKC